MALQKKVEELQQQMLQQSKLNKNQQLQSVQQKCNNLHNQNLQLIIESDQIKKQLETSLIKQVEQETEFNAKMQQFTDKMSLIDQYKQQITTLTENLNQSQSAYKNVMKQLFDQVLQEDQLQVELNKLRDLKQKEKQIQQLTAGHDLVQQLQQQTEQLQSENKSLNNILEQKVQIIQDLQEQIHELQSQNQQLQSQTVQIQQDNSQSNNTQQHQQIRYQVYKSLEEQNIEGQMLDLLQRLDEILVQYDSTQQLTSNNIQQLKQAFIEIIIEFLKKQNKFYIKITDEQLKYFEENLQIFADDDFIANLILYLEYDFKQKNCMCCNGRMLIKQQLQDLAPQLTQDKYNQQLIQIKWNVLMLLIKLRQKNVSQEQMKQLVNECNLNDYEEIVNNI